MIDNKCIFYILIIIFLINNLIQSNMIRVVCYTFKNKHNIINDIFMII